MKVNLWGINYHPEPTGIAVYSTRMCDFLKNAGHTVSTTTAFPYYPNWRKVDHDLWRNDTINGVEVLRNWVYVPGKINVKTRILHELSFVVSSMIRQLVEPPPDVYFVVSPPLLLGAAAALLSFLKRRPFVFHVQDLQPDAAVTLGMIKKSRLIQLLYKLESVAYKHAAMVTVISDGMKSAVISKGVPEHKVRVIPNAVDFANQSIERSAGAFKRKFRLAPHTSIISYAGNLGVKQGLEVLMEAASHLQFHRDLMIVICGDGAERSNIEREIKLRGLNNVRLFGVLNEEDYLNLLRDSDVCVVTLKPGTGASFLPSKVLSILAAGKPIITNADAGSALHEATRQHGFGLVCRNDGASLTEAIRKAIGDPQLLASMSVAGRTYVNQFDVQKVLPELEALLALCVFERRGVVAPSGKFL